MKILCPLIVATCAAFAFSAFAPWWMAVLAFVVNYTAVYMIAVGEKR